MQELQFFSHEKISDRLYKITEGYSVVHRFSIGVVIGDTSVLVIDAGLGVNVGLRHYVESIVGKIKPIICVCTHCHPDHVGAAKLFDSAFCSHLDWPARADFALNRDQRLNDLTAFASGSLETIEYGRSHMMDNKDTVFEDIKDGDIFDLGSVYIKAIALPGHSAGSMVLYNEAERYAFTGDSINTDVHLKKLNHEGLARYKSALERFRDMVGHDVVLHPAHLPFAMTMDVVDNLISGCKEILTGRIEEDPPGETIFTERNNNDSIRMHYVANTCIVYNEASVTGIIPTEKRKHLTFHSYERVSQRILIVTEGYSMVHRFTIGVVVGDERVLVVDSGLGMDGNLRQYIERLVGTEKPIECACTHGAIDHAGSACLFDKAYLNERDYPMLSSAFDRQRRIRDLGAFSLFNREVMEYCQTHMIDNTGTVFYPIDECDELNLGGVVVKPVRTPGHSKGHLAYYVPSERIVFCGDGVNMDTHLKKLDRTGFLQYHDMLGRFIEVVGEDAILYAGHLNRPQTIATVRNLMQGCAEFAYGDQSQDPHAETIFQEKTGNPAIRMHYHGNRGIVYDSRLL